MLIDKDAHKATATLAASAAIDEDAAFVALAKAVAGWRRALGEDRVDIDRVCRSYEANCLGLKRTIPVVLRPRSEAAVQEIVKIAQTCRVPLYPISTGHNWGYGSAMPTSDRCVLVDLSDMAEILSFDAELGLITVQPGVTQGGLQAFLDAHGHRFMVPVTGAGPSCSLVGNALERGYGITPYADHFAAVQSLRAVLPDGSIYRPALAEAGGTIVDGGHKWGVGPYLDGLYSQGGFGIVTAMTIALAPLPETVEAFLVEVEHETDLEPVVEAVRDLLQKAGGVISAINIMNRLRLLSMFHAYPHDLVCPGQALPAVLVDRLGVEARLPRWLVLGALYGDREVVAGLRVAVRRRLKPHSRKITFVSRASVGVARKLAGLIPPPFGAALARATAVQAEVLDILTGRPRETALRLAYWKQRLDAAPQSPLDPARDGCGIMWFSPLVPMKAEAVRDYVEIVKRTCPKFGFDPLITLTTVTPHCFDSTVPILYDLKHDGARAHDCFHALFETCQGRGYLPYRLNVEAMSLYTGSADSTYWRLVGTLKAAIDPNNIIAPGRYAPTL